LYCVINYCYLHFHRLWFIIFKHNIFSIEIKDKIRGTIHIYYMRADYYLLVLFPNLNMFIFRGILNFHVKYNKLLYVLHLA